MLAKDTPVIILCGGQGTRIADVSGDAIPKPLVPVGGKPILWHIMKIYAHHGYTNFILALGHLGWEIKNYFLNHRLMDSDFELRLRGGEAEVKMLSRPESEDWRIVFAETGAETQTGQRVALCSKYVTGDHFMVTYGDGVADIDLGALAAFALDKGRIGTVTAVTPSSRFGQIEIGESGDVTAFAEKQDAGGRHDQRRLLRVPARVHGHRRAARECNARTRADGRAGRPGRTRRLSPRGILGANGHDARVQAAQRTMGSRRRPVEALVAAR